VQQEQYDREEFNDYYYKEEIELFPDLSPLDKMNDFLGILFYFNTNQIIQILEIFCKDGLG